MQHLAMIALQAAALIQARSAADPKPGTDFFRESFEDASLTRRGWYDGDVFKLAGGAAEGSRCVAYPFETGKILPTGSKGARHLFDPSESVFLKVKIRLERGWDWTGRNYGPHLLHFMTTENGKYHGPAASHLTVYIEPVNGRLRLAAQDIQNKDAPHGLTQGPLKGGYNGQFFDSEDVLFTDDKWHTVEAYFRLNTLDASKGEARKDGIARAWFDGKLVVDRTDVVLRSVDFPNMKFNQFLMLPYFHHGVPHDQTLWLDDLSVGHSR